MKKNWIIIFTFIFCFRYSSIISCPTEQSFYLTNIEKALDVSDFNERFDALNDLNLRAEVKELLLRIHEEENTHPDFIQCVTAQDSLFYAYQVIAKELYRKLYGQPKEDFEFLRFPTQKLLRNKEEFFARYPSLALARDYAITSDTKEILMAEEIQEEKEFLSVLMEEEEIHDEIEEDEASSESCINDIMPEISKELISVNFTMETYLPLDSALFVFLSGKSVSLSSLSETEEIYHQKFIKILSELFDSLALPPEKLKVCMEKLIKNAPRTDLGIINQIFLPKDDISNFIYFCYPGGFLHPFYDSNFEESYKEFQNNRQEKSFRTFRNFQARIIVGSLFEDSRVKIFRYTLIPDETQRRYEAIVKEAIEELLAPAY